MKNTILTICGLVLVIGFIFLVPFGIDCAFEYTHRQEMYTALEVLDEYNFSQETELEFRELISEVAQDSSYNIFIKRCINGIEVKVVRTGEYSTEYYRYFME